MPPTFNFTLFSCCMMYSEVSGLSSFKNFWNPTTGCGDIAYCLVGYFNVSHPVCFKIELYNYVWQLRTFLHSKCDQMIHRRKSIRDQWQHEMRGLQDHYLGLNKLQGSCRWFSSFHNQDHAHISWQEHFLRKCSLVCLCQKIWEKVCRMWEYFFAKFQSQFDSLYLSLS